MFASEQSTTLPICEREDIRGGKWVERPGGDVGEYRWEVPDAASDGAGPCRYHADFDLEIFCGLMANAVVMMIGDSLMWEMYASLARLSSGGRIMLYKRINRRVTYQGKMGGFPVIVNVCENSNVTLVYRWSKHLEGIGRYLREQSPTMIVLNTGAHYQNDNYYRANMKIALKEIEGWQGSCRGRNLTCPFYWRTSPPGIPNCTAFGGPVNNLTEMERVVDSSPVYHWEQFRHQNEMALGILESSAADYGVVDGYEIGIQRPDTRQAAEDCLHNADPAIADAECAALLHYLRATRTGEDVAAVSGYRYDFDRATNVNLRGTDLDWDLVNSKDYPYK